ncbi:hypothetical protein BH09PLA1_BH09PLA1_21850 [soil metagenome]
MRRLLLGTALFLGCASGASAAVLTANTTANNGGSPNWAMFFDLSADAGALTVTDMTTASTATAGSAFSVEIFTRTGSALGGPVASGPGSSTAGWTSLGTANATQGPISNDVSLSINIPDISVPAGQVVGVAVLFTGAGPRYLGTGTPPLTTFDDGALKLVTGDARSVPFTTTGSFFTSRAMTGSLTYAAVPEPASLGALALIALMSVRRRRSA